MPYSNPISDLELQDLILNNPLHPRDGSPMEIYMPQNYFLVPPANQDGPVKWRLFDAAYIQTGIIDPNRLGTGATGAGNLYLADDGTWKPVSTGGGSQTLQDVTDLGNTTTNTIDTAGTKSDYFLLDTLATPTLQPGMFRWNDQDGVPEVRLKGNNVTGQLFLEDLVRVVNKTGATLNEADFRAVRIRSVSEGGSQGQRLAVLLAQADSDADSATMIGLVTETILDNQEGFVARGGEVREIDTTGAKSWGGAETWVDGDILYLSPTHPGYLTKIKPVAPQHLVIVGWVVYAHAVHGKIHVKVDNGYELDELHNVLINSAATGQLLRYSGTVWENWTPNFLTTVPTLAQVTTAGNTTTNNISVGALTLSKLQSNIMIQAINVSEPAFNYQLYNSGSVTLQSAVFTQGLYYNSTVNGYISFHRGGAGTDGFLSFGDSGGERMRIAYGGNVLIGGTINSTYKLDVSGNVKLNGDSYLTGNVGIGVAVAQSKLHVEGNSVAYNLIAPTGNATFKMGDSVAGASRKEFYIVLDNTNNRVDIQAVQQGVANRPITINASGGNVGIGTNNPSYALHTVGVISTGTANSSNGTLRIERSGGNNGLILQGSNGNIIGAAGYPVYEPYNYGTADHNFNISHASIGNFNWYVGTNSTLNSNTHLMRLTRGGNLLIGTTTDGGYKLDVVGNSRFQNNLLISGTATISANLSVTGSSTLAGLSATAYTQLTDGVPRSNLGQPTVTEMALFDTQFNNKVEFYPQLYGSAFLTFETYNGTTWTDVSSTISDTDKKKLFGGDSDATIVIPNGVVQYQITLNNTGPYVFLNALYAYWSSSGHNTQVQIWAKHNAGSWVQITNSTTNVNAWPGHLYLPHNSIAWHPAGTLGVHYNQVRIVFTPTWNASFPSNNITLYRLQWWGGYPAGKRVVYTTDEQRNVTFPALLTATGGITSTGAFTANSSATFNSNFKANTKIQADGAISGGSIEFQQATNVRGALGVDTAVYGSSNTNITLLVNGANDFDIVTNLNRRLTVKGNGNILIGTTTDTGHKLNVEGTVRINNTLFTTGVATLGGIIALRNDTAENVIQITQASGAAAAHLYSKGDGYLGWIGYEGGTSERRYAFESNPNIDSGRHFNLIIYDANGANQATAFSATRTAFSIGVPLTVTGTITATGGNSTNWNTAYGWGNHATAGYLTSYTETDPTVPGHVKAITTNDILNWNTAFGWGDHAGAGYLLSTVGWTGNITIPVPSNPPGQQTIDIQVSGGQITNVTIS